MAGHDHQAAALAVGAAAAGALLDSLGTAEALLRCVEGPLEREQGSAGSWNGGFTAGWGVVRGRFTVLAGLRSGMVLERVAAALGASDRAARRRLGEQALALPGRGSSPACWWQTTPQLGGRSPGRWRGTSCPGP